MAKNEDVNQPNQGAPAADIPDLKKKEKERKRAGAAWSGAKPGGGSFSGATGGTVARSAASAASSAGGAASGAAGSMVQSTGTGWLSSMIARLTATAFGKLALASGAAFFLAGAGLYGYAMLYGGTGEGGGGMIGDLGAIASSMKVRAGGGDRTGYIASNGEIRFDPIKAAKAKKAAEEKAIEEQTAGDPVLPDETADAAGKADWKGAGLGNTLSGSKLSSSLGGGFGGKNIFAGSNAAPKFDASLGKVDIKGGDKGRLSAASKRASTGRVTRGGRGSNLKSNKAFGQLKVAKGMSALGAGSTAAEGASATSAAAFDGQTGGSGNVEGTPGMESGAVDTPSGPGGAPDVTAPDVSIPGGVAVDPNTAAMLGAIAEMAKKAGEMKAQAKKLMLIGIALIAAGASSLPFGAILIAIGAMLVGMSIMMSQMAEMMKGMADSMSQGLAARTSDIKQDEINQYCIDKAYNEGTDPANCNPPESVTENQQTLATDAASVEEHDGMVIETSRVEGVNGEPTPQ